MTAELELYRRLSGCKLLGCELSVSFFDPMAVTTFAHRSVGATEVDATLDVPCEVLYDARGERLSRLVTEWLEELHAGNPLVELDRTARCWEYLVAATGRR